MESIIKKALHYILPHYYQYGRVHQFLPSNDSNVGGTSMDFYVDAGIPLAFTIELPDLGQLGYLLPEHQISQVFSSP